MFPKIFDTIQLYFYHKNDNLATNGIRACGYFLMNIFDMDLESMDKEKFDISKHMIHLYQMAK